MFEVRDIQIESCTAGKWEIDKFNLAQRSHAVSNIANILSKVKAATGKITRREQLQNF